MDDLAPVVPKQVGFLEVRTNAYWHQEYTWRFGKDAADHFVRQSQMGYRERLSSTVGFACWFVGDMWGPRWLAWISIPLFMITAVYLVNDFREVRLLRAAVMKAVAPVVPTKKDDRSGPREPEKYLEWCKKLGLKPYPFKPTGLDELS